MEIELRFDEFVARLSRKEILTLVRALNEVLHGISIPDFEIRVVRPRSDAERLLAQFGSVLNSNPPPEEEAAVDQA